VLKRLVFLDWLRVFATLAVVTIHVSGSFVGENLYINSSQWFAGNLFESISRSAVPLFVMISGALMLKGNKKIEYKEFLWKRVSKIIIPLVAWSIIYYIFYSMRGDYGFSLKEGLKLFIKNGISYPLWFLYMILGLYLITPVLKIFIKNASQKDIGYFLILWLYASVIVKLMTFIKGYSFNIELYFATDYVGYFILGYYLSQFEIPHKWRKFSYVCGVIGIIVTFILTYVYTVRAGGQLQEFWYGYFTPNVLATAVGLFIFCRYKLSEEKNKLPIFAEIINECSFGIYLSHILVLRILSNDLFLWINAKMNPFMAIPMKVVIIVAISSLMVMIIKRIPMVGKIVS
jgi:surface polysaccharide O-acyltransferase-like enzyme